jgi:hypothetical protein
MTLHCSVNERHGTKTNGCPVEGRRPAGLLAFAAERDDAPLGAYFAECEWLEAASVIAFDQLASELARHGAPTSLVEACHAARRDEIRHTDAMAELRARFGGQARPVETTARCVRSLFDLAAENAVEGLVRETYGAAVALWRAERAADPSIRRTLEAVAEDECRHADLARALATFFDGHLRPPERRAIARLQRGAIDELAHELEGDPPPAVSVAAGVPRANEARAILAALAREVWAAAA